VYYIHSIDVLLASKILKEVWTTDQTEDKREKIRPLSLAKEYYSM
jgi:hypothetical protein